MKLDKNKKLFFSKNDQSRELQITKNNLQEYFQSNGK